MGLNGRSKRQRLREKAEDLRRSVVVLGHKWVIESIVETDLDKNVVFRLGSSRVIRGNRLGEVSWKGSRCSLLYEGHGVGLRRRRLVHQNRGWAIVARRHVRHGGCRSILRNRWIVDRRSRHGRGNQNLSGGDRFQGGNRYRTLS